MAVFDSNLKWRHDSNNLRDLAYYARHKLIYKLDYLIKEQTFKNIRRNVSLGTS